MSSKTFFAHSRSPSSSPDLTESEKSLGSAFLSGRRGRNPYVEDEEEEEDGPPSAKDGETGSPPERVTREGSDSQVRAYSGVKAEPDNVECIVPFPDGDIEKVITDIKTCPDWFYHADWCWRNHEVASVEDDDHGAGIYQHRGRHEHEIPPCNKPRPCKLSVQRVKNNGNFVPKAKQDNFERLIAGLLKAKTKDPITDCAAQLFDEFPDCYDWLSWWLACDTAAMLFPGSKYNAALEVEEYGVEHFCSGELTLHLLPVLED
ncbi:unnamed protein product [Tilletia caries]|uniref:Uncharacterized protein n=1 Tax=Tilletia caries TaxID=13290 RepID=A0ABN7J8A6_9BASI|nr:unnamed protein product [Tilletia caries]